MSLQTPKGRLYVVVGVLLDGRGDVLIQQRRAGTPRAGQWEFPGGKRENGEPAKAALTRELMEELGIRVESVEPLVGIAHDYDHARVWLDTYLITAYSGIVKGREGQAIAWTPIDRVTEFDVLEAVHPILKALRKHPEIR